jgi:hypothetical protein
MSSRVFGTRLQKKTWTSQITPEIVQPHILVVSIRIWSVMKNLYASLAVAVLLPFGVLVAQDQDQQGPVEKTENGAKKAAHKTGETVKNGAQATGSAVSKGVKATERTVGKGLEKTGSTIRRAGTNPTPVRHHRATAHSSPTPKESPVSKPSPTPEQSTTPVPAASPTATP